MAQSRTLGGRYELVDLVARGGMAHVHRARDLNLGRTVAVKVLDRAMSDDEAPVLRFRREARQAASLAHPNIVAVFDHGTDGTDHYIVMEYIGGGTLADLIRDEGPLDPGRVVRIATQVCDGLSAAHQAGVVHRDIKPANIMFDASGRAKVTDFGIARALSDVTITRTGTLLGSAAYLSPEQASGRPTDPRTDVYSLGCVLYEMTTGSPPFTGQTPITVATHHVRTEPTPPLAVREDLPPALSAVILSALAKDPADRPASAAELRAALERVLAVEERTGTLALVGAGGFADTVVVPRPAPVGPDTVGFAPPVRGEPEPGSSPPSPPAATPVGAATDDLATATPPAPPLEPRPAARRITTAPPAPTAPGREPRRERRTRLVLGGLVVLALVLAGVVNREPSEPATAEDGDGVTAAVAPVVDEADELKGAIDDGKQAGWLPDEIASAFHSNINEAVEAFVDGDRSGALGLLGELRAGIGSLVSDGAVGEREAFGLLAGLGDLEQAIRSTSPPGGVDADDEPPLETVDESEPKENSGRGKGKGKKDDDDD